MFTDEMVKSRELMLKNNGRDSSATATDSNTADTENDFRYDSLMYHLKELASKKSGRSAMRYYWKVIDFVKEHIATVIESLVVCTILKKQHTTFYCRVVLYAFVK